MDDYKSILRGFEMVTLKTAPFITLDKQQRLYLSAGTRRITGIKPYDRIHIAYNAEDKALAIIRDKTQIGRHLSAYTVDRRYYVRAVLFAQTYGFSNNVPYVFLYEKSSEDKNVHIFRLKSGQSYRTY